MQETIKVQLTEDTLYDFILFHTYSRFSGFITNILGLAVAFMGIILYVTKNADFSEVSFYIVAAAAFLCFTPLRIKCNARRLMKRDSTFCKASDYCFCQEGIWKEQGGKRMLYEWDGIQKIVATPKTIGIYCTTDDALIVPKAAFGDRFMTVMQIVALHVKREKVKFG